MLLEYDRAVCPACGNLRSECSDPDRDWHPRTVTCYATATTRWGWRRLHKIHEGEEPVAEMLHPLDGVSVWVSDVPPPEGEDEFA